MSYQISQNNFSNAPMPIVAIAFAQQAALLPLYFFIPIWICVLNLICVALVVVPILVDSNKRQYFKVALWLKVLITIVAVLAVLLSFKSFSGRDAGVALIAVMYGLKILETRKVRDANLLLSLGFFILVSGFLFSQKPWIAFYQVVPVLAILNALVIINSIPKNPLEYKKENKTLVFKNVFKKLTQYLILALPIMVILFVFFPRLSNPLWRMPGGSNATTGVSDSMTPGDISALKLSDEIAFRAQFFGREPNANQLYWRVLILDEYDGVTWTRQDSTPISDTSFLKQSDKDSADVFDYTITLEATSQKFLTTLDRPIVIPNNARLLSDFVLYANSRINDRTRYQLKSLPSLALDLNLSDKQKAAMRSVPESANPKSLQWAKNHRQLFTNDWDYILDILTKINQQEYFYTLTPPIMDEDMVDSFWFDHKKGFCEHYAGALVYLARAANIPARVVIGYQGGEKNPLSDYWIIRNSNAHAWTEIWIEGRGWVRVDPTSAIAPHRVENILMSDYRQRESLFDNFDFVQLEAVSFLKQLGYWQDQFNAGWNDWILDYNDQSQKNLFKNIGLSGLNKQQMIIIMIVFLLIFLLLASSNWFKKRAPISPLAKAYIRLLKKLDQKKIVYYDPCLGPNDLKKKLNYYGLLKYQNLISLLDDYIRLRYRETEVNSEEEKKLVKQLNQVRLEKNKLSFRR